MTFGGYTWFPWVPYAGAALLACVIIGALLMAVSRGRTQKRKLSWAENTSNRERRKDQALFLAALVPSVLVWLSVMGVSFIGLTGFAADVMRWDHWTNMLVPLSLDGISVSFGAWAFVAVKRGRHPGRSYKIVFAAATMSALLNLVHGRAEYSIWAGGYLAFLSFAGMAMFHELLDQFMAQLDDDALFRGIKKPRFGERWLWAPKTTFQARKAWIVHPVPVIVKPTIGNALAHLVRVQKAKGKKNPIVTITYTDDLLLLFPDGLFPSPGETLPVSPGESRGSLPVNGQKFPEPVPPHVNGYGKRNGSPSSLFPDVFPGGSPENAKRIILPGREFSPEDTDQARVAHLVELLEGGQKLTIDSVQKMFKIRQPAAKSLLTEAKAKTTAE